MRVDPSYLLFSAFVAVGLLALMLGQAISA
jgi:hypothetical protein